MNDEQLDREIRAALGAREPGPLPESLRARVAAIPATTRASRWPSPLAILRGGLRLAAVTAAVALVVAVADYGLDRSSSGAGTLPEPTVERVPFVIDGAGFFSRPAVAEADRRLDAVFRTTGLEATLVTQREPVDNQLSTPDGFPERYDRDGNPGRDIVQVVGIDPNGTISCCLSASGAVIDRAVEDNYWPPLTQVGNLTASFASAAAGDRDAALGLFVDGVERTSGRIDQVVETIRTGEAVRSGAVGGLLGAIVLVTIWLVRGRPVPTVRLPPLRRRAAGAGLAGDVPLDAPPRGEGWEARATEAEPAATEAAALQPRTRLAWRAHVVNLGLAVGAVVALAGFLVQGLVLAPAHAASRPVDLSASGFGLAASPPPIVALGLLVAAILLLIVLATRLGRAGWALISLVVVGVLAFMFIVAVEQPEPGSASATGLGFEKRESAGPQGIFDFDYYPVATGQPFTLSMTVRNPGPLPMTILGLGGTFDKPGPGFVSGLEVIGLGTRSDDLLSGSPTDAEEFQPVRLDEDHEVQLLVVGRGGTCAAGPLGAVESVATLTHLPIAYSVLGVSRIVEIGLPSVVAVPTRVASCEP
jgi:hypothetical protein